MEKLDFLIGKQSMEKVDTKPEETRKL